MAPRPVILDTNFLLLPFQFRLNIFTELEYLLEKSHKYVISSRTLSELERIGKSIGKNGMAARLALKMIGVSKIEVIQSKQEVDDWIVDYAKANHAIVCTNDTELRLRLKDLDIKTVSMKSKSKLGFI